MNVTRIGEPHGDPADAARLIACPDCDANLRLAQKTRRRVRDEVISNYERRMHQMRNMGLALTGFMFLLVLLAPTLWNGLEDLMAGDHIFDLPVLVALLTLMLLPAMLAALIAVWKGQQDVEHDRGGIETFRQIEK
jgi:hypothetical protein